MKIKKWFKNWWNVFKEDLLFNTVMSILCFMLGYTTTLLFIFGVKEIKKTINEPEEKMISVEELVKYCPNVHEKLEEFMGGDITPTEEGQAWIDSICEVANGN